MLPDNIIELPETAPSEWSKPDDDKIAGCITPGWAGSHHYFNAAWRAYSGGVWQQSDDQEMRVALRRKLREMRQTHRFNVSITQGRVESLLAMLQDDLYVTDREVTARRMENRHMISLRNGVFNLNTMQLEPHKPDAFFTHQMDFDYNPDAHAPTFTKYLASSLVHPGTVDPDPNLARLVTQALAYSMTARTDMKASFWLVGEPDSGKSTFIAFIRALMGSLHGTIDLNQLATNRFLLSELVGKRVVTFTESMAGATLPDAIYKAMVGGEDEIYADVKNKPGIAFKPEFKIWWAMNKLLRMDDRSGATANRLKLIPFNRSIPKSERIANLVEKLASERAGIFNSLILGYQYLERKGDFIEVEQSAAAIARYSLENDTEKTFLQEACEVGANHRAQSQVLYDHYKTWCDRNGFRAKNRNRISDEWRRLGLIDSKIDGKVYYHGARISDI